jgi:hypothetical protein
MWRIYRDVRKVFAWIGSSGRFHANWRTDAAGPVRGAEIQRWLGANGNPSCVVIDDKAGGLETFRDRLVLTDNYCGLTVIDATGWSALLGRHRAGRGDEMRRP